MSRKRDGFSCSKTNVRRVVSYLARTGACSKIYLFGSRSPATKNEPKKYSDWDLMCQTEVRTAFPDVARIFQTAVDIKTVRPAQAKLRNDIVEIWPNDIQGILK